METKISEMPRGVYRLFNLVPNDRAAAGFTFNRFSLGDEPLLFSYRPAKMFPLILSAVSRLIRPNGCAG